MRAWKNIRKKLVRKSKPPIVQARALLYLAGLFSGSHAKAAQRRINLEESRYAQAQNAIVLQDIQIEREQLELQEMKRRAGMFENFAPPSDLPATSDTHRKP